MVSLDGLAIWKRRWLGNPSDAKWLGWFLLASVAVPALAEIAALVHVTGPLGALDLGDLLPLVELNLFVFSACAAVLAILRSWLLSAGRMYWLGAVAGSCFSLCVLAGYLELLVLSASESGGPGSSTSAVAVFWFLLLSAPVAATDGFLGALVVPSITGKV